MILVNEKQVWDLYIAGYTVKEIAKITSCSESTVKRRIKSVKEGKQLEAAKTFNVDTYEEKEIVKPRRMHSKNDIIKMYLDGYSAKEISIEKKFDYYDVKNIIRNFRREVGNEVFKESYEKLHNYNKVKLKERIKEEKYRREIIKTTGMDVRSIISDCSLIRVTQSQYHSRKKAYVLTADGKRTATWDLPRRIERKIL